MLTETCSCESHRLVRSITKLNNGEQTSEQCLADVKNLFYSKPELYDAFCKLFLKRRKVAEQLKLNEQLKDQTTRSLEQKLRNAQEQEKEASLKLKFADQLKLRALLKLKLKEQKEQQKLKLILKELSLKLKELDLKLELNLKLKEQLKLKDQTIRSLQQQLDLKDRTIHSLTQKLHKE